MKRGRLMEELKMAIEEELKNCDSDLWPITCKLRSSEAGYKKIEKMIIGYVVKEAMPIGAAIALIEQELQHLKK